MKIEIGKTYVTRGGVVVGPLKAVGFSAQYPFGLDDTDALALAGLRSPEWMADGRYYDTAHEHQNDLVKEAGVPAAVTLSIVGTVGEVVDAFFALPQYQQEQMLRALLARGLAGTI